jgi:hypothetical protein
VGGHQSIPARKDSRTSPARRSPRA